MTTPIDRAELERATTRTRCAARLSDDPEYYVRVAEEHFDILLAAARAHLATLPKTKIVECWRVEWAFRYGGGWVPCASHYSTRDQADQHASEYHDDCTACWKVTGPHQQEVPST